MAWTDPATATTGQLVTAAWLNQYLRDNMNSVLPIGTLIMRVAPYVTTETAVEGRWLMCNGVAVSRTTYAALFNYLSAAVGLQFGAGDGSTTFNVPDLRGRAVYAAGEHADVDSIGDNEGAAIGSRTPSHHHRFTLEEPATGNGSDAAAGNTVDTGESGTTTGGGTQDKPAYLVAGCWFIKFTE